MSSTTNREEGSKPPVEFIKLKVKGPDGHAVFYRIKRSTRFRSLMNVFREKHCIHPDAMGFSFEYNGGPLDSTQTPDELQMKNGDEILTFLIVPQYYSMESAYRLREKLMKQLEYANAFISENEGPDRSSV